MRLAALCLLVSSMLPSVSLAQDQVPIFKVTPEQSDVKFFVKASVAIDGKFKKWDATLTFASPAAESAVIDVKIYADSVDTGSDMKDGKLRGKDFFNAKKRIRISRFIPPKFVTDRSDYLRRPRQVHDSRCIEGRNADLDT